MSVSIPYWGKIDANIDWCESNYTTTPYIAEFANTLSSLPIVVYGIIGLLHSRRYALNERRHTLCFIALSTVGLGSASFHMTLRRLAQSFDELPMMWATLVLLYNTLDIRNGWHPKYNSSKHCYENSNSIMHQFKLKFALFMIGVCLTTLYYVYPQFFLIFFTGYATLLCTFIAIMAIHIYGWAKAQTVPPLDDSDTNTHNTRSSTSRPLVKLSPLPRHLFKLAFIGYVGGFVIWCIENALCGHFSFIQYTYGHAVWHLSAGLGTYCIIQNQICWRAEIHQAKTRWTRGTKHDSLFEQYSLPYITVDIKQ